jgi:calcium/calmodulin-dependent protein kinase I
MDVAGVPMDLDWFKHKEYTEDYIVTRALGEGSFGDVKLAENKATREMRAIKIIAKSKLNNSADAKALKQECELLLKYGVHPNIAQLYEVYISPSAVSMVMELVDGGDLFDGIIQAPAGHLTELFAATVVERSCKALAFLHKRGIAHRDIKPENIMLKKDLDVNGELIKLADFGFARLYDTQGATMSTTCGTPEYVAPEVLKQKGYGCECDVWSMGVVLYIMLCGYAPFHNDNVQRLFQQIMRGRISFPDAEWAGISPDAKELVQAMLKVDPATRITARAVLENSWIKKNVTAGPETPETAVTEPLAASIENMRSFSGKRKFKAIVRKQMFLHAVQGAVAESSADGTLESSVTEKVAAAMSGGGADGEHPIDPSEYVSGVHEAISEHGDGVVSIVSVRQAFAANASNQVCADTGARLHPSDTWVSPSRGVFISSLAASAHQTCGLDVLQMGHADFTPEQIARVSTHGNEAQNAIFEALPTAGEAKAAAFSGGAEGITEYVKAKYVDKNFCLGGSGSLHGVAEPAPAPETADFESTLRVLVRRGENLKKMDYFPYTSDPYCVLKCGEGCAEKHTKVIANNLNPVWDEELAFNNISADAHLSLTCWDQDLGFSDDPLGVWTSDKPISELCAERGVPVEVAAVLTEVSHGIIHFTVTWG